MKPIHIALLAIGGYVAYTLWKNTASAAALGSNAISAGNGWDAIAAAAGLTNTSGTLTQPALAPLPGDSAPTSQQVSSAINFWSTLTPEPALASGYINFPSGSQAGASLFGYGLTAKDNSGNYYVQWAGGVYRVANTPDTQGNWASVQVA